MGQKPFILDIASRIQNLLTKRQRKQTWGLIGISFFGSVLEIAGLASIIPYILLIADPGFFERNPYVRYLYEILPASSKETFLLLVLGGILLLFLLKNAIALWIEYLQGKFAFDVATGLSEGQANYFLSRDFLYHQRTNNHEVVNKAKTIPFMFGSGILLRFITLIGDMLLAVIILGTILFIDFWIFIALGLVLTPLVYTGYSSTKNKIRELGEKRNSYQPFANASIYQISQAFPIIKLYNKDKYFLHRFVDFQDKIHRIQAKMHVYSSFSRKFMEINAIIGIFVITIYTFFIGFQGEKLFLFLSIFATASYKLIPSLSRIFDGVLSLKAHQYTLKSMEERPFQYHSTEPENSENEKLTFERKIVLKDIEFAYPDANRNTLSGLNLTIPKGEIIGIAGGSGEGKSTLLYVIMQLLVQNKGEFWVDDQQITGKNRKAWQKKLGLVWHDNFILNTTLEENIAFAEEPGEIDRQKLLEVIHQAGLQEFVDQLPKGTKTVIEEEGRSLSAGQKQRLAIARALYQDAGVLLFDEATNALDTATENIILQSIKKLKEEGKTIVIISHRFSTLRISGQIRVIENGKLSEPFDYSTFLKTFQESQFLEEGEKLSKADEST